MTETQLEGRGWGVKDIVIRMNNLQQKERKKVGGAIGGRWPGKGFGREQKCNRIK